MNKTEATKSTPEATAQFAPAPAAAASPAIEVAEKSGKKKRKYSKGLKELQQTARGLTKANRRIAKAVAAGFSEFARRDNASSQSKRDGAIRDIVKNWSRGFGKAVRRGSEAPYELAKAFDTKSVRRAVRDTARFLARPFTR
jgi:hypothetical protein